MSPARGDDTAYADASWAFDAYLAVGHRLPAVRSRTGCAQAHRLPEIAEPFDLVLLDAYGVLNVGETAIEGAAASIAALRRAGKAVAVVSNSAGYPKHFMMQRYRRLGFDFAPGEVATSREALLRRLSDEPRRRWGLMLNPANGTEDFEAFDTVFLGEDTKVYDAVEGFLLVGSDGWTETRQAALETSLLRHPRPVLVGNPDIVAPREDGLSREPGHFAHRLADATGITPQFFGKPFSAIFELALSRRRPRPRPARVLMVGDTLHTDVLGGQQMGFATALVTENGSLAGSDIGEAVRRSGIVPDYIIDRI